MKPIFSALSIFALLCSIHAATTYNNTVSGSQTASAESGSIALNLNATGDLPGMLSLTLKHEDGNVNGGAWTLTVLPPNADASSSETGTLTGTLTSGALTLDANGIATAANSVQLNVQSGTGQYGSITAGSGTLNLSADPENSTKLGGPLVLDF
ncbi:MAG TPA: hypothetical protein VK893_01340 [Pyrinomonadaceae bacterium]|nr:hypothetical protein [Pyrinomonadaceae bacterium]